MSGHHHDQGKHVHHHHLDMALALTAVFAIVEFAGGWISNSLALFADAVHLSSDVVALAIAAFAGRLALRPAHNACTWRYAWFCGCHYCGCCHLYDRLDGD